MLRKGLLACIFAGVLATSATAADIVVRIAPPAMRVERRPPPPMRGYVWTPGYHRWDGNAYVWTGGVWVQPPRPNARWVQPKWHKRGRTWVFAEGHWR